MEPEYAKSETGSGSEGAKTEERLKQMSYEKKLSEVVKEIELLLQLPRNSNYAFHRLRLLNKIHQLLCAQRTKSQDDELEMLFSGFHL